MPGDHIKLQVSCLLDSGKEETRQLLFAALQNAEGERQPLRSKLYRKQLDLTLGFLKPLAHAFQPVPAAEIPDLCLHDEPLSRKID